MGVAARPFGLPILALLSSALLFLGFGAAAQQEPPPAPASPPTTDRIVAVVDQDPLLLSDIEQVIGLGLAERREGESEAAFRRRVLDGLIERRLRLHEVGQFGFEDLSVETLEAGLEQIKSQFPSEQAFEQRLAELAMTEDDVRQLVIRQETVLRYVEERLGPRVFVSLDDIQAYYEERLVPALKERGAEVPPLEDLREEIRALLKAQRLNDEIDRWTERLRREADIEILLDDYPDDLPPVVERLGAPGG
jgi:hypothetical protein